MWLGRLLRFLHNAGLLTGRRSAHTCQRIIMLGSDSNRLGVISIRPGPWVRLSLWSNLQHGTTHPSGQAPRVGTSNVACCSFPEFLNSKLLWMNALLSLLATLRRS